MKRTVIPEMALWVALITMGAYIRVPIPVVPFTMQVFFTQMAGAVGGPFKGAGSVLVYVLLGLIGVPVFVNGGGLGYVFQPTFGYLLGFIVAAFVTGIIVKRSQLTYLQCLVAHLIGLAIVYLFGVLWLWGHGAVLTGVMPALRPILMYGFVLCAPGDIVLSFLAAELTRRILKLRSHYGTH